MDSRGRGTQGKFRYRCAAESFKPTPPPPLPGGVPYETGGDARGEFWIKPQKETNLGVAQPFWPLKEIILNFKKVKRMENT